MDAKHRIGLHWYVGQLAIQYDVADLKVLVDRPDRGFAIEPFACGGGRAETAALSDLIAPIVVEADGAVVPLQYGFSKGYRIGNINSPELSDEIVAWKREVFPEFLSLCRRVYDRLLEPGSAEFPFVNWYGQVLQASHSSSSSIVPQALPF